jgi:hypothetical protein
MSNDINSWWVTDEKPGIAIDTIEPISKRATCLIARNKSNHLLTTDFFRIQGTVDMMKGLDYHHANFMKIIEKLAIVGMDGIGRDLQVELLHEATAYLNRLGQFYYFLTSDFVSKQFPTAESLAPTVTKFVIFRQKYSAHRSIDDPRKETTRIQTAHAYSMSSMGGKLFQPKPNHIGGFTPTSSVPEMEEFIRNMWRNSYQQFQLITDDPKGCHNFSVEREHPTIMQETYVVLKLVLGL